MPSHPSADRSATEPPGRGTVDALISQTHRLRGEVDAVRQEAQRDTADPRSRWERALYDLALHQLSDLGEHLLQLRDGPPLVPPVAEPVSAPPAEPDGARRGPLISRVGSAEWNLLTDEAGWSAEFCRILGRDPASPALTLDELPSLVLGEDRPRLTAMITDCLVEARLIDGEFRIVRPDGTVRTVHMMGEPVVGTDGGTASMWAVLRDVSELRRNQSAVRQSRDVLRRHRGPARAGHPLADGLGEAAPPWRGTPRLPCRTHPGLDLAAHHLPASAGTRAPGHWCDALGLSGGDTLLSVGGLTGQGHGTASDAAMLLGALRGLALAGAAPGRLMNGLSQLLDAAARPALGSAVCCRYRPATRTLVWARAGHPAPLLFRDGTGREPAAPDDAPLGAAPDASHGQAEETLQAGDLLVLHTGTLVPGHSGTAAVHRLLGLAPRFGAARSARDCVRTVLEEFAAGERADDACVLVARVTP